MPVRDEIEEVFSNQTRAGGGIGYNPNKAWSFVVLINWQKSRVTPVEDLSIAHYIWQLKVSKRFKFVNE